MDWETVFLPSTSVLELVLRGTVLYLAVFVLMRVAGRRESGELNMADLILVLVISEAASIGIGGEAHSTCAPRRELLTRSEIDSALRQQGIDDIARVYRAFVEPNDTISVIERPGG